MKRIREYNEILVLRTIQAENPISRVELARRLNLSRAALTGIVQRLVDVGLLMEVGRGSTTGKGGRREVLLSFNPAFGAILAVEIDQDYTQCGLFDLNINLQDQKLVVNTKDLDPSAIIKMIAETCHSLIKKNNIELQSIIGMGVGMPGVIDYQKGQVIEGGIIQRWHHYPLCAELASYFSFPVFIENNVKAVTLGEFFFGSGRHAENLVCFWFGNGIGVGMIRQHSLYRGYTASAGELGFWELIPGIQNGLPLVHDDSNKIWGDLLSLKNFFQSIRKGIDQGWNTMLKHGFNLNDVLNAVEKGDPLILHLFKVYGKLMGQLSSLVLYIVNPSVIVFAGPFFSNSTVLFDEIRKYLQKSYLHSSIEKTELRCTSLKNEAVLVGAASLVLNDFFLLPTDESSSRSRSMFVGMKQSAD